MGAMAMMAAPVLGLADVSKDDRVQLETLLKQELHAVKDESTAVKIAHNVGQQWNTRFDGRGFETVPHASDHSQTAWSWGLQLEGLGRGTDQWAIQDKPLMNSEGARVTYDWGAGVQEWFVNDSRGLEHGFTLARRWDTTDSTAALSLDMSVRGGLIPHVLNDGRDVRFLDQSGRAVVNYSGLKVWDADGKPLNSRFTVGADRRSLTLTVADQGAKYPVTIDPIAQQAYVKASNLKSGDRFGQSLAVSGDRAVIGALLQDGSGTIVTNCGAVYVYRRNAGAWVQEAILQASNPTAEDYFGSAVAISGETIVVGAPSEDSAATGVNGNQADNTKANAGAAYVFVLQGGQWVQQAYLKASNSDAGDNFGYTVGVSGDSIVVGAPNEDSDATTINGSQANSAASPNAGAAYVFVRSGTNWTQQAYLKASNAFNSDQFGGSVAISGNTIIAGAAGEDSRATGVNGSQARSINSPGAAYVFVRSGSSWSQQAYLKQSNTEALDGFGANVALDGDTAVVTAIGEDSSAVGVNGAQSNNLASNSGAAYVFARNGLTWSQQAYLKATNTGAGDVFGSSVALSGDLLAIGANKEDGGGRGIDPASNESAADSGAVYLYRRTAGSWAPIAYVKASNTGSTDSFGSAVAVDDSKQLLLVGANQEDGGSAGLNGLDNNSALESGAAYAYDLAASLPEIGVKLADGTEVQSGNTVGFNAAELVAADVREFRIQNTGEAPLANIAASITGANAGDFVLLNTPATSIPVGGEAVFEVRFKPTAVGARSATLSLISNDSNESPFLLTLTGTGLKSSNAALASLIPSIGSLAPLFAPTTTSYAMAVANSISSLTVKPTAAQPGATLAVRVGTAAFVAVVSGRDSAALPLNVGENRIDVRVVAENLSSSQVYSLVVTRAPSSEARLGTLVFSSSGLAPAFSTNVQNYTLNVAATTANLTLTSAKALAAPLGAMSYTWNDAARVDGAATLSNVVFPVLVGSNTLKLWVTAQDGVTKTETTVTVVRPVPPAPEIVVEQLGNVVSGDGRSFGTIAVGDPDVLLTFSIKNTGNGPLTGIVASLANNPGNDFSIVAPPAATVAAQNGSVISSTNFTVRYKPLSSGDKSAQLQIVSNDSDENPFVVSLSGKAFLSNDASLSQLVTSSGTLVPVFSKNTVSYEMTVPNAVASMAVTPTATRSSARIKTKINEAAYVNATNAVRTALMPLNVGENQLFVQVTAPDNLEIRTYTIRIIRLAPPAPQIAVVQGTPLLPQSLSDFGDLMVGASTVVEKTYVIQNLGDAALTGVRAVIAGTDATSFQLTKTPAASVAAKSGQTIAETSLKLRFNPATAGTKSAELRIFSNDSDSSPFVVLLTGEAQANNVASLASLVVSPVGLTPAFAGSVSDYTATGVQVSTSSINLTPTVSQSTSSIQLRVNDGVAQTISSAVAKSIPLVVGANRVVLTVTAQDGVSTRTYRINVQRPAPEIVVERASATVVSGSNVNWGSVLLRLPKDESFLVKNIGDAVLNLNSVAISGAQAADYSIIGTAPKTLAPGASVPLTVRFTPSATGVRNASLSIASNDADEAIYTIGLTGTTSTNLPLRMTSPTTPALTLSQFNATGLSLALFLDFEPTNGQSFTLINQTGTAQMIGQFSNVRQGGVVAADYNGVSYFFTANYTGGTGNDLVLTKISPTAEAVLVSDSVNRNVMRYDLVSGQPSVFIPSTAFIGTPTGMVVGSDRELFVIDVAPAVTRLLKFRGDTGAYIGVAVPNALANATFVATDQQGNFYLQNESTTTAQATVTKYDASGTLVATIVTVQSGRVASGIAIGPDQLLYVTFKDKVTNKSDLYRFTTSGTAVNPIPFINDIGSANAFRKPTWDAAGRLWLSDYSAGVIYQFDLANGGWLSQIDPPLDGYQALVQANNGVKLVSSSPTGSIYFIPNAGLPILFAQNVLANDMVMQPFLESAYPEIAVEVSDQELATGSTIDLGDGVVKIDNGTASLNIKNLGQGSITGLSATIIGAQAQDFQIRTAPATTVAPGQMTSLEFSFTPRSSGRKQATLRISSNDVDESVVDLILIGQATEAEIAVSNESGTDLSNGNAVVMSQKLLTGGAVTKSFTVSNLGFAPLSGIEMQLIGANAADFRIVENLPTAIGVGGNATFVIRFAPTVAGAKNATLRIASNDASEDPFTLNLSGTAVLDDNAELESLLIANATSFTPSLQSGVYDYSSSVPFIVERTVVNAIYAGRGATARIRINGGTYSNMTDTSPQLVLAEGDNVIELEVTAENGLAKKLYRVNLLRSSKPLPEINIDEWSAGALNSGDVVSFVPVSTGLEGELTFVIKNDGVADLNLSNLRIDGANAAEFSVSQPPVTPVLPGTSTTFVMRFSPVISGPKVASVIINSNDVDEAAYVIKVNALATVSNDYFAKAELITGATGKVEGENRYASAEDGEPFNDGGSVWYRWIAPSTGAWRFDTVGSNFDTTLNVFVGDKLSELVLIETADDSEGLKTSVVYFPTTAGQVYYFQVDGYQGAKGFIELNRRPVPEIEIEGPDGVMLKDDGERLDLEEAQVGIGKEFKLKLKNIGSMDLSNFSVNFDGNAAADFSIVNFNTESLSGPNGTRDLVVKFLPSSGGYKNAVMHLTSNDGDENPFDITFRGKGVLAPVVTTGAATVLSSTTASISASVSDNYTFTNVSFNYGETNGLGTLAVASPNSVYTIGETTNVTANLSGLKPSTTYFYRVEAFNRVGSVNGEIKSFTTPSTLPGAPLASFDATVTAVNGVLGVNAVIAQPDGKLVVGGSFTTINGTGRNNSARLASSGALDSFNPNSNESIFCAALQSDGKVLFGGAFTSVRGVVRNRLARVLADGTIDETFNPNVDGLVNAIELQEDGKVLIAGAFTKVGGVTRSRVARLNADGSLDTSFAPLVSDVVYSLALQNDGKIVLAGNFTQVNGVARTYLARIESTGALDAAYNVTINYPVTCLLLQSDNKLLMGGTFFTVNGVDRFAIARLSSDGTLDATFDPLVDTDTTSYPSVKSLAQQADGKLLLTGEFDKLAGVARKRLARINANGSLDTSFPGSVTGEIRSLAISSEGSISLGGVFTSVSSKTQATLALLDNSAAVQTLELVDSTKLRWNRSGSAPQVTRAYVDSSADNGETWKRIGKLSLTTGGWEASGLSLPNSGLIRVWGVTRSGLYNGSSGLVSSVVPAGVYSGSQSVAQGFIAVPAGSFVMGSADTELGRKADETQRTVTLSKGFFVKKSEVTLAEWREVREQGAAKGYTDLAAGSIDVVSDLSGKRPVTGISWWDAIKWCNLRSEIEGKTPVYYQSATFLSTSVLRTGKLTPVVNWNANGYRLPTEAEWEYSCRAGTQTSFFNGDILNPQGVDPVLQLVGVFKQSVVTSTAQVGSKLANAFGLFDTHGNVAEWCWDGYDAYNENAKTDPRGPDQVIDRVVRGGSWTQLPAACRAADRAHRSADDSANFIGLRPVYYASPDTDEFVTVPAGNFVMGSALGEYGRSSDESQHLVTISKAFRMSKTEVTYAKWQQVRERALQYGYTDLNVGSNGRFGSFVGDGGKSPATNVNWFDVIKWCNLRSQIEGRTPVYYTVASFGAGNVMKVGVAKPFVDWNANGYRLPTEAEWEYACRAGTTTAYYTGDYDGTSLSSNVSRAAVYWGNVSERGYSGVAFVGTKAPNAFGLYDMHGNAFEWCWDEYGAYDTAGIVDPKGPSTTSTNRMVRSGFWCDYASGVRSAKRGSWWWGSSSPELGFRTVYSDTSNAAQVLAAAPAGYALVNAGTFVMGSPTSETGRRANETQRQVTLTKSFLISKTELTWGDWSSTRANAAAYGFNDMSSGSSGSVSSAASNQQPVTSVTWWDAIKWCNLRSLMEGKTPAYYTTSTYNASTVFKNGNGAVSFNAAANGYRLPTEAEWEYACRSGSAAAFYLGDISRWDVDPTLNGIAWYYYNQTPVGTYATKEVGRLQPNNYGLYDTLGNVWEWCYDGNSLVPGSAAQTDPIAPSTGDTRGLRGGAVFNSAYHCRAGLSEVNSGSSNYWGFRPVLTVAP